MLGKRLRPESSGAPSPCPKRSRFLVPAAGTTLAPLHRTQRSCSAEYTSSPPPSFPDILRRRASSVDSIPQPVQLTEKNLASFEATQSLASMPPRRTASPSRNASGANIDEKQKLDAYSILFDMGAAFPPELKTHIDVVVKKSRDGPASPSAQRIIEKRRRAAVQNEATGIATLEEFLLFNGQVEDLENGVPLLEKKANINLNRYFLPDAPNKMIKSSWGTLSMPQPDRALGYVTQMDAQISGAEVKLPFSKDEEQIANWYRLSTRGDLHFPFLTAQFKSLSGGDTIFHANCQSARDGAIITNYLHRFYSVAYAQLNPPRAPSVVETCHFSLTCEMWSLALWAHWREVDENGTVQYRMELIYSATLGELDPLVATRRMLRNIVDWSLNERLRSIKAALPLFWDNPERPPQPTEERDGNASATPMALSSETGDALSATKRRRLVDEG